jgi:hypothetical protein
MNTKQTYKISVQCKGDSFILFIRYDASDRSSIRRIVEDYEEDKNPMIAGGVGLTRPCVCALAWASMGRPEKKDISLGPEHRVLDSDIPDDIEWIDHPENWSSARITERPNKSIEEQPIQPPRD